MKAVAVIPARYGSTRLPGKPLLDICGKPLIQRVWEVVARVHGLDEVFVATDDERIAEVVRDFGGKALMTSADCQSGSDRVSEVSKIVDADVYVNVQGDEPLLESSNIEKLLNVFTLDDVQVATLCCHINKEEAMNPNNVKVVLDHIGNALYFSRYPLPYICELNDTMNYLRHIGVYAYRREILRSFVNLPVSPLEHAEKLEQLRFIQAGIPISVIKISTINTGIDTQEDLEKVREVFIKRKKYEAIERLKSVKLIVTDVDGILTDGSLYYGQDGEIFKRFNARDGLGVKLLQSIGINVAIISGRDCIALRKRIEELKITEAVLGQLDKCTALVKIMKQYGVTSKEVAFIGDDIPDVKAFCLCSVSITVKDAPKYVREKADIVIQKDGGCGAFRDVVDLIINNKTNKYF